MTTQADDIEALLPQTQCGECGFHGCRPYAKAISTGDAAINLCPPGGKALLEQLAILTKQDATPYLKTFEEKPLQKTIIDETRCIGCLKCIKACPVDAIIGAQQRIHTVIEADCTGCGLCIEPCPVDCIEMEDSDHTHNPNKAKMRYLAKTQREKHSEAIEKITYAKHAAKDKKAEIAAALSRVKQKKD